MTATDGAPDKRLGTASVTVQVTDVPDEPPVFLQTVYTASVPENAANYPVVKVHVSKSNSTKYLCHLIPMSP